MQNDDARYSPCHLSYGHEKDAICVSKKIEKYTYKVIVLMLSSNLNLNEKWFKCNILQVYILYIFLMPDKYQVLKFYLQLQTRFSLIAILILVDWTNFRKKHPNCNKIPLGSVTFRLYFELSVCFSVVKFDWIRFVLYRCCSIYTIANDSGNTWRVLNFYTEISTQG